MERWVKNKGNVYLCQEIPKASSEPYDLMFWFTGQSQILSCQSNTSQSDNWASTTALTHI